MAFISTIAVRVHSHYIFILQKIIMGISLLFLIFAFRLDNDDDDENDSNER